MKQTDKTADKKLILKSKRLESWIIKNKLRIKDPKVFKSKDGRFYIGYIYDGDMIGTAVWPIIFKHKGARYVNSYPVKSFGLKEVKNFWKRYEKLGVCLLDPAHKYESLESYHRFRLTQKEKRVCACCGFTQVRKTTRKLVIDEYWETLNAKNLPKKD